MTFKVVCNVKNRNHYTQAELTIEADSWYKAKNKAHSEMILTFPYFEYLNVYSCSEVKKITDQYMVDSGYIKV